jgi:hypothetical protein
MRSGQADAGAKQGDIRQGIKGSTKRKVQRVPGSLIAREAQRRGERKICFPLVYNLQNLWPKPVAI